MVEVGMEASGSVRRASWYLALALVLGFAGGFAGASAAIVLLDDDPDAATVSPDAGFVQRIAAEAAPSIVTILNEGASRDEFGRSVTESSFGSGVIIDSRGFIVTNEHVIRGATRLTVRLYDGEKRRGVLVGHDGAFTDLAVVKVEGPGKFQPLDLGDSDALRLGQRLVAIGQSLADLPGSVTTGIVSGLHREWPRERFVLEDVIQTDAAINHGNSGGALLNERGELVGINTTVVRQTAAGEAVEGIGLAISSRTIREVALPIIEQGRKPRPSLGIEHVDVDPDLAVANGLPPIQAALVTEVKPGSPAERGGLRINDLILSMDGMVLSPERPYANTLMRITADSPIEVLVLRQGFERTLTVTPVEK